MIKAIKKYLKAVIQEYRELYYSMYYPNGYLFLKIDTKNIKPNWKYNNFVKKLPVKCFHRCSKHFKMMDK